MYRVELKDMVFVDEAPQVFVPFLMYRVELKAYYGFLALVFFLKRFLMYRVELKVEMLPYIHMRLM